MGSNISIPLKRTRSIVGSNSYVGVVEPATSDLAKIKIDKLADPIRGVVSWFRDITAGVAAMHRQDRLHRDIKPENIVVFTDEDQCRAELTDFGLSGKSVPREHPTGVTLHHAPTFILENTVKQRDRKGIQTKEADLFSLGRTMLNGGIVKLFQHYAKLYNISFNDLFKEMKGELLDLPDSDEELLRVVANAEGPVIVLFKGPTPAKLIVFPTQEKLGRVCQEGMERLIKHMSLSEYTVLKRFVELATRLQNEDPSQIPTAEEVEQELNAILATPNAIPFSLPKVLPRTRSRGVREKEESSSSPFAREERVTKKPRLRKSSSKK